VFATLLLGLIGGGAAMAAWTAASRRRDLGDPAGERDLAPGHRRGLRRLEAQRHLVGAKVDRQRVGPTATVARSLPST